MVFKKLKEAIDKNKTRADEKKSKRLGFNTIKEYEAWKEEQRVQARKQAFKINRAKAGAKLQKEVIYNKTTSGAQRLRNNIDKSRDYLDSFQDAIQPPKKKKSTAYAPKKTTKRKTRKKKNNYYDDISEPYPF